MRDERFSPTGSAGGLLRLWRGWGWICLWFALLVSPVLAERRFPPPDFESGYTFPEERHPEARSVEMLYLDATLLVVGLGLASWLTLRRRSRRGIVALSIGSLLYFGFYRRGCICAIGSIQNVALTLADSSYALPLTVLLFFAAPLAAALFFGRGFCAGVCPHGALQDLVLIKPVNVPRWMEQGLGLVPFVYLGLAIVFAATGSAFLICRWDPFVPLFRLSGSLPLLCAGMGLLVLGMFVGRPYCRFLCPYGALLRLASLVSKWRVRITPDTCTQCRLCEESCPYGVIREPLESPPEGKVLLSERRLFLWLIGMLPLLLAAAGYLGARFVEGQARLDSKVGLAEMLLAHDGSGALTNLSTPDQLAIARAQRTREPLLAAAVEKKRALTTGGWMFGAGLGVVIGLKLLSFSFWRRRSDYEPDRGGCFGCGRCFTHCPQERVRLGLTTREEADRQMAQAGVARRSDGGDRAL